MAAPIAAMKAYAAAQKAMDLGAPQQAGGAAGPGFAQILQNVMGDMTQATKQAETQMTAHAAGKAELVDVVTSVASASASLETVMAVRDQVISAYQEIMRMPL
ncbi:MAG: flagellar hook-basal body complex protein FliE [Proteobacteria bacterium]|nr:flagellar hook-basal body complex protein FliE [Pseudomonadota bacterium]